MYLSHLRIKNHPILKDVEIDLTNPKTGKPYAIVAFVGENGCGKTTLLNQIFDYQKSEYIIDREKEHAFSIKPYHSLFLRQSSLARNAQKEIGKLIDGQDRYSAISDSQVVQTIQILKPSNPLTKKEEGLKLLETLNDPEIYKLFKEGAISEVACGAEITKLIDGKEHGYDISKYSSGQQEILLKLKDLNEYCAGIDSVLLDEPETSLHPRWQLEIVNLVRLLLKDANDVPQIFLATHSEKVLQSLIGNEDALIVRLYKNDGKILTESISQMDLCLPSPTFAELNYIVFHISSMDYHDQLLTRISDLYEAEAISDIDKTIRMHPLYDKQKYGKVWVGATKFKVNTYKTLPVYIRNYFHHPKDGVAPTEKEVESSIIFLREIIKTKIDE